jgi:hypothetical protein
VPVALPGRGQAGDQRDGHGQHLDHRADEDADLTRIAQLLSGLRRERGANEEEGWHGHADDGGPPPARPQGDQARGGQQDDQPRRDGGAPEAIWITIPAAAATRPATFSLPAADNILGLRIELSIRCSPSGSDDVAPLDQEPSGSDLAGS